MYRFNRPLSPAGEIPIRAESIERKNELLSSRYGGVAGRGWLKVAPEVADVHHDGRIDVEIDVAHLHGYVLRLLLTRGVERSKKSKGYHPQPFWIAQEHAVLAVALW